MEKLGVLGFQQLDVLLFGMILSNRMGVDENKIKIERRRIREKGEEETQLIQLTGRERRRGLQP